MRPRGREGIPRLATPRRSLTRRGFIGRMAAGTGLTVGPFLLRGIKADAHHLDSELFPLGVYSGDPSDRSVVIGTRVAPDPLNGGGLTRPFDVMWEVATDPGLTAVLRRGTVTASPQRGGSVRVVVDRLPPETWLYYRFQTAGQSSRVGRTRTFPGRHDHASQLTLALASCQDYRFGFYSAYRDIAQQGVDCVVHVGDYIYEDGSLPWHVRQHTMGTGPGGEALTLTDYRNRYAQYRLDDDLKAAHAAAPWIVTWDDHEVDNNYAGDIAEAGAVAQGEAFRARKRAAYQAYDEMMPLRPHNSLRGNGSLDLFRTLSFGDLADFHILDTRQFRTDQPCGDGVVLACGEESEPTATMLGTRQGNQLERALRTSRAVWNLIAQQTMMTRWDLSALIGASVDLVNMDAWDGYAAARQRLTDFLQARRPQNPVVLSGDIHASFAADILQEFGKPSTVVAAEIVGTSISSPFIDFPDIRRLIKRVTLDTNPHIRFHEGALRGYVLCQATRQSLLASYKGVLDVANPASAVVDVAQVTVRNGTPGLSGDPVVFVDPDGS